MPRKSFICFFISSAGWFATKISAGGKIGMLLVGSLGIIGCLVTLAVGFIAPEGINVGTKSAYPWLLLAGLAIMSLPPFILHRNKKRALNKLEPSISE